MRKIKVKTIYRHFKGGLYFVEDVAINSETEVIYAVAQKKFLSTAKNTEVNNRMIERFHKNLHRQKQKSR